MSVFLTSVVVAIGTNIVVFAPETVVSEVAWVLATDVTLVVVEDIVFLD
jgi:hypothetical protein